MDQPTHPLFERMSFIFLIIMHTSLSLRFRFAFPSSLWLLVSSASHSNPSLCALDQMLP